MAIDLTLICHILQVEVGKKIRVLLVVPMSASARQEKARDKEQTAANTVRVYQL
ncbi:hypothetical protein [Pseudomonas fluorescens]|uniref:hypothetical protein n=1 Tax=Pseudomonas fluorescens TaxID=294 RepID=UPI001785253C|nr:hypothetical protein [Pseudomonas fluorescens]